MYLALLGEGRHTIFLVAFEFAEPGDDLPDIGPTRQGGSAVVGRPSVDDAGMVERLDAFDYQPLQQRRGALPLESGAALQLLSGSGRDPK